MRLPSRKNLELEALRKAATLHAPAVSDPAAMDVLVAALVDIYFEKNFSGSRNASAEDSGNISLRSVGENAA